MPGSNFIDYVKIYCRSGKGGAGSVHLHRAKYLPKGGPDGGDGGKGGDVILQGNRNFWTLLHLRYRRNIIAQNGGNGGKALCHGSKGDDAIIEVPLGTVAYNGDTGEFLCEVTEDGQRVTLLKGGRGGLGNWQFRTATRQTPRFAQPGEPSQELNVVLQLKLLADVGLVGFPNAGKSTLLSVLSSAKPKIADYPFTTLEPSLGIVACRDGHSFVMADIPGIISGASQGKGLGLRFLRHIERNPLLLFLIPADSADVEADYRTLAGELAAFSPDMADKPRLLAITKCDLADDATLADIRKRLPGSVEAVFISSVAHKGLTQLTDSIWEKLNGESRKMAAISSERLIRRRIDVKAATQAADIPDEAETM